MWTEGNFSFNSPFRHQLTAIAFANDVFCTLLFFFPACENISKCAQNESNNQIVDGCCIMALDSKR